MASDLTDATRRLLLTRIRAVMIGVGALAGLLVASTWMIDEGEIVKITTVDADGDEHETEVWIVDLPSGTYLRSGRSDTGWLERLRVHPEVVLKRDGTKRSCTARVLDSPQVSAEVSRAMAEKYGFADDIWGAVSDRSGAVPIRLSACDAAVAVP
jgi:hypothetical protein